MPLLGVVDLANLHRAIASRISAGAIPCEYCLGLRGRERPLRLRCIEWLTVCREYDPAQGRIAEQSGQLGGRQRSAILKFGGLEAAEHL